MTLKIYSGNYSLQIGQPYVILCVNQDNSYYTAERYILFDGFNGHTVVNRKRTRYPNIGYSNIDLFIEAEIENAKSDIFHVILWNHFREQLEKRNFNVKIELKETNDSILMLLRDKFPIYLDQILADTNTQILREKIHLYKSVIIEKDETDL